MKIDLKFDDELRTAAVLYKKGKKHAMQDETVDGIACMLEALHLLEPLKGESHRILRGECLWFIGMMETWRGRYGTAHDMLEEATNFNPNSAVYWAFLAQASMKLGADKKAIIYAEKAEVLNENDNVVFSMLETIFEHYGNVEKAAFFKEKAAVLSYNNPDAYYLLGNSNYVKGDKEEAGKWYQKAIELDPAHTEANYGYGLILSERHKFAESIPYFTKGMGSEMSGHASHWGRALSHLMLGEYEQGFKDFEMRFTFMKSEYGNVFANQRKDKPEWHRQTEPSRIHVYSEQGFGDCIQFSRYVHLLCDMGHKVTFEVDMSLVDLMKHNFPKANIVKLASNYPGTNGIPEVDYRISLGSLPFAFGTTLDNIPLANGYLITDPHKVDEWRIIQDNTNLKVGLCWAGGKRFQDKNLVAMDEKRSISFETMKPLLAIPQIDFFSLQANLAAQQADSSIYDTMKNVQSWSDTAGIIANLDLVISVDTAVLHLAAAMGKPTWLLNKEHTCWRWMQDRIDSPWYDRIRIFRYKSSWDQVIAEAERALSAWSA